MAVTTTITKAPEEGDLGENEVMTMRTMIKETGMRKPEVAAMTLAMIVVMVAWREIGSVNAENSAAPGGRKRR